MRNRLFPNYPDDADYTTNAPSYYDDMARKQKLIELLSKRIWEYNEELAKQFDEIAKRFRAWDQKLEDFPEDVKILLQKWLDDETLDHIINETIFNWKLDTTIFEKFQDETTAQLQQTSNVQPKTQRTIATLIFDDAYTYDYSLVYPYLEGLGIKAGVAIVSDYVGSPTRLTVPQMLEMQENGWEMLSHSKSHANLPTLPKNQLIEQLQGSKESLEDLGLKVDGVVYPLNFYNDSVLEEARKFFKYSFALDENNRRKWFNTTPINQYAIYRIHLEEAPAWVQQRIEKATQDPNAWIVFMGHSMYYDESHGSYKPNAWANAVANINYIIEKGIPFVTPKQGIEEKGNSITIGDDYYSKNKFFVSKSGLINGNVLSANILDRNHTIKNTTKGSEFDENKLTIANFLIADDGGLPTEAGTLYTYKFGSDYGMAYQQWNDYNTGRVFTRNWVSASDTWTTWTLQTNEFVLNNSYNGLTKPLDFMRDKYIITQVTDNEASKGGLPIPTAGVLETYNVSLNAGYWYQTYRAFGNNKKIWTRNATSTTTWGQWLSVGTDYNIDNDNTIDGLSRSTRFEIGTTVTAVTNTIAERGGLPITSGGTLTTVKPTSANGYAYQTYHQYSSPNHWRRHQASTGDWGNWVQQNV